MRSKNNHQNGRSNKIRKIMSVMLLICSVFQMNENAIAAVSEDDGSTAVVVQEEVKESEQLVEKQPKALTSTNTARSATDVLANWEYSLNGDLYTLTKYIGTSSDIVVPSLIEGKKVAIDIGTDEFANEKFFPSTATSITIEDTGNKVTLIQDTLVSLIYGKHSLTNLDLSNLDTSNITNMTNAIAWNNNLKSVDVTGWDTRNVTLMNNMLYKNKSLEEIKGMNFNTSNVTSMVDMFSEDKLLTTMDVSSFNTSSVKDMSRMFLGCESLEELDVSGFDTTNVMYLSEMFMNCKKVKALDVTNFDTPKVTEIMRMFAGCESLVDLDVSGFTTAPATDGEWVASISDMFSGCKSLKKIDLSSFNSTGILLMAQAFANCSSIQVFDLEGFDTPKLKDMDIGIKNVFSIIDPNISEPVPTIIITDTALLVSKFDKTIPGRTYGGPLYDANGGELSSGVEEARYFDHFIFANRNELSVTKNTVANKFTPTKQDSTFTGWYTDEKCTTPFVAGVTNIDLATDEYMNLTLYAGWVKTVNFDSRGGSTVSEIEAQEGNLIMEPNPPTKAGASFVGWYKDGGLTEEWDFASDTVSDNITLYAAWGYNVTFAADNGTSNSVVAVKEKTAINEPAEPSKPGYTFNGWYKESTFNTPWDFAADTVSADTTLYAEWKINEYTVTFGNTALDSATIEHGKVVPKPIDPTKTGYTFKGWHKESTFNSPWDFTNDKIIKNTTIYAEWESITSKVVFDAGNGEASMEEKEIVYDQPYGTLPTPTNGTLIFGGWYTEEHGEGTQRIATDIVNVVADETLYAYWLKDYFDTTDGNLRFEYAQDSRYVLQIDANDKEFVQDSQNLKSVYDIYLLLDNDRVSIKDTEMWVSIKLKENEQNYTHYRVSYINEQGEKVEEYIPTLSEKKDALMFKVTHLSYYAVYAWNVEETPTEPSKPDGGTPTEPSKPDGGTPTEPSKPDGGTPTEPSKPDESTPTEPENGTANNTNTPKTGDTTNMYWFLFTAGTAMLVIIATLRKKKYGC